MPWPKKILVLTAVLLIGLSIGLFLYNYQVPTNTLHFSDYSHIPTTQSLCDATNTTTKKLPNGQLVSPNGQWMVEAHESGRVPWSRSVDYYLEFISLQNKPDQFVHFDWSERSDGWPGPIPIGWSDDGKLLYVGYGLNQPTDGLITYGQITTINLCGNPLSRGGFVDPYKGAGNTNTTMSGAVVDLLPRAGVGLWLGNDAKNNNARLITFTLPYGPEQNVVVTLPAGQKIVSTELDSDGKKVAYIIRQNNQDRVYIYDPDATTTEAIDPSAYTDELKKAGLVGSFTLSLVRTTMLFDNEDGLFFRATDAHGHTALIRRSVTTGKELFRQEG